MNIVIRSLAILLAAGVCAAFAAGQALSGTYTCAAGNPGGAFDYGDIGQFFDALEVFGVSGPTTLEIYDDGGAFSPNASYLLGADGDLATAADDVPGLGPTSPLRIVAPIGENPEIVGSGAPWANGGIDLGALSFANVSHVTVEGLTIRGANFGIIFHSGLGAPTTGNRISRCHIYGIAGPALFITNQFAPPMTGFSMENCMVWGCTGTYPIPGVNGVIGATECGGNWTLQHNTIVHAGNAILFAGGNTAYLRFERNIVVLNSSNASAVIWAGTFNILPAFCNWNCYRFSLSTQRFFGNYSFIAWRSTGRDLQGIVADPLFINNVPGQEDLRLQPGSPAIDRSPMGPSGLDIDGKLRPVNGMVDSGAWEFGPAPGIAVEYQQQAVVNGSTLSVGGVPLQGRDFEFTIRSTTPATLWLSGSPVVEAVFVTNCSPLTSVTAAPHSSFLPGNQVDLFRIRAVPLTTGAYELLVRVRSNDPANGRFEFLISGTATPLNTPPAASPGASSVLMPSPSGTFESAGDPGSSLLQCTLALTDAEGDAISVTTITPTGTPPAGIVAPAIPAAGHPVLLTWSGVRADINDPTAYARTAEFTASGRLVPVKVVVAISVRDLAPVHNPAPPTSGSGTQIDPYRADFLVGDGPAVAANLSSLDDPNKSQQLGVLASIPLPGNPTSGAGFQFNVVGSVLTAAPTAPLLGYDVGTHEFQVFVTDGLNVVVVWTGFEVTSPNPLVITSPATLRTAKVGKPYDLQLKTSGGSAPVTWSISQGQLPDGLMLDPASGRIDGIAQLIGIYNFTLSAQDSIGHRATQPTTLSVKLELKLEDETKLEGDGCAGTPTRSLPWILMLLAGAAVVALRRAGQDRLA